MVMAPTAQASSTGVKISMVQETRLAQRRMPRPMLGVGDGPVTITYRDSNDRSQSFVIQIDIEPPMITIESPVHNSRSDDEKPSFVGTINDGDAGLAADSFQLYVDNDPTAGNEHRVLSISQAVVGEAPLPIERRLEYIGFGPSFPKYGVIGANEWMDASDTTPAEVPLGRG